MRCLPKLCAQYALSFILTSNNTSSTALRSPFPSRGRLKKASSVRVILSERMRVEALRSAGGAKPRNEVTKGSSKDYSQPILLLLFATKERDPSTPLRSAQDDTERGVPTTTHFAIRQNFTSTETSLCRGAKLHLRSKLHSFRRSFAQENNYNKAEENSRLSTLLSFKSENIKGEAL